MTRNADRTAVWAQSLARGCRLCCSWRWHPKEPAVLLACRRSGLLLAATLLLFALCVCVMLCTIFVGDLGLECPVPPSLATPTVGNMSVTAHHQKCWARASGGGGGACPPTPLAALRLKGHHNSYHVQPPGAFWAWGINRLVRDWHYTNPSLTEQLDGGARHFELDIHFGANGQVLAYHMMALDDSTVCKCLSACLAEIRAWSDAHRSHLPIVLLLEVKEGQVWEDYRAYVHGIGRTEYGLLDATLRQAWADAPDRLFTPDDLRGSYASLARAVVECGWPDATEMLGKTAVALLKVSHGYE